MTGNELERLCRDAVREAGENATPTERLARILMRDDPEAGHHRFARTVDRLRGLAPELDLDAVLRGVARGEITVPAAWIGGDDMDTRPAEVQITLEGLSISVNGKTIDIDDPEAVVTRVEIEEDD